MENIARKERRRLEQTKRFRKAKRGAAIVGTAMVGCSVAAPLVQPVPVQADETPVQFGARINTVAFITEIATYAQPIAQANDLYASVMIAQAVVESGWGSSALSQAPYYNLFGIKGSYQGQTVYMDTLEFLNNQWVNKKEPFRQYPSFAESFNDNAYVLRNTSFGNGYYYAGTWKSNTRSYTDATACLTGRYATDPGYASKLNNIITTYGLTQYDTPASGNAGGGATTGGNNTGSTGSTSGSSNSGNTNSGSATSTTYTVQSGDSVWGISNKFGITMDQLIQWNNIQNNFIYPGQKLTIKGSQENGSSTNNSGNNTNSSGNAGTSNGGQTTGAKYTVQSGDSVWKISNDHGITMAQLIEWNNIKNNFVYPGQQLIVSNGGSSNTGANTGNTSGSNSSNSSSSNTASGTKYTVKAGDSVWSVSNKYGITMAQLIQWNNIQNNFIYPGQQLTVSNSGSTNSASSNTGSSANTNNSSSANTGSSSSQGTYTVKAGESVWSVANKNGITMNQLIEWNNIKNNFIYPGQQLIVKGGNSVNTNTGSTTSAAKPNTPNTSATTSTSSSGNTMYTVKAGESVWSVANKHHITMDQLIEWNNIKNNFIYPGQQVIVKKGSSQTTNQQAPAGSKTYTVKSGESVWGVADSHGITMAQLIEWNNIKNNFIYPGQTLIVAK
ncbi:TPA: LysM peptidoglycan-binding domain-containing protein [Enterococcus faecium]|uniref:LysM peptidoglycan-binding domain-containing protein n=1 Tax=Enterococcus lactis TaxID=357441 RepID=UPI0019E6D707|nr:LysM peptidoglycan-binding domain-containing protein [Enterococcus lactis]EGP5188724.1 LysM peptidoglycan-binding domain-containing protein [Enterococcus faecium]EGP5573882.1 LysM peptidoglycan-binding domain-containing protein [Enterococcus faecium]MCW8062842.1 LysM peptidoglycan-binding domain-containing protein [Enterococcus lactis]MDQ8495486.1 LysM peptidoglycan-binding domain-containing protein [Enterococcus faecium]MDT2799784.1 LysM peptidoglycan-binding domain-containing protein [Ent